MLRRAAVTGFAASTIPLLAALSANAAAVGQSAMAASALADKQVSAPPEVRTVLRRACYDCHSDRTRWPWYAQIPPAAWLIRRDVRLGRRELNFSRWGWYYPATRRRKLEWMGRVLREGTMPPWRYRLMHPGARLSAADRALLEGWARGSLAAPNSRPPVR